MPEDLTPEQAAAFDKGAVGYMNMGALNVADRARPVNRVKYNAAGKASKLKRSKYDVGSGFDFDPDYDYQQERGRNQDGWQATGQALLSFVPRVANTIVQNGAFLIDGAVGLAKSTKFLVGEDSEKRSWTQFMADNAFGKDATVQNSTNFDNWISDNFEIYKTKEEQDSIFNGKLFADVINGAAFTVGLVADAFISKGLTKLGAAGKAMRTLTLTGLSDNIVAGVSKIPSLRLGSSLTSGALSQVDDVAKIVAGKTDEILASGKSITTPQSAINQINRLDKFKRYTQAGIMGIGESAVETTHFIHDSADKMEADWRREHNWDSTKEIPSNIKSNINRIATSAAPSVFFNNMLVTAGTNMLTMGIGSPRMLQRFDQDSIAFRYAADGTKRSAKQQGFNWIVNKGTDSVSEFMQEYTQSGITEAAMKRAQSAYMSATGNGSINFDQNKFNESRYGAMDMSLDGITSVADVFSSDSKDALKEGLIGALTGPLVGGIQRISYNSDFKKMKADQDIMMEDYNIVNRYNKSADEISDSIKNGSDTQMLLDKHKDNKVIKSQLNRTIAYGAEMALATLPQSLSSEMLSSADSAIENKTYATSNEAAVGKVREARAAIEKEMFTDKQLYNALFVANEFGKIENMKSSISQQKSLLENKDYLSLLKTASQSDLTEAEIKQDILEQLSGVEEKIKAFEDSKKLAERISSDTIYAIGRKMYKNINKARVEAKLDPFTGEQMNVYLKQFESSVRGGFMSAKWNEINHRKSIQINENALYDFVKTSNIFSGHVNFDDAKGLDSTVSSRLFGEEMTLREAFFYAAGQNPYSDNYKRDRNIASKLFVSDQLITEMDKYKAKRSELQNKFYQLQALSEIKTDTMSADDLVAHEASREALVKEIMTDYTNENLKRSTALTISSLVRLRQNLSDGSPEVDNTQEIGSGIQDKILLDLEIAFVKKQNAILSEKSGLEILLSQSVDDIAKAEMQRKIDELDSKNQELIASHESDKNSVLASLRTFAAELSRNAIKMDLLLMNLATAYEGLRLTREQLNVYRDPSQVAEAIAAKFQNTELMMPQFIRFVNDTRRGAAVAYEALEEKDSVNERVLSNHIIQDAIQISTIQAKAQIDAFEISPLADQLIALLPSLNLPYIAKYIAVNYGPVKEQDIDYISVLDDQNIAETANDEIIDYEDLEKSINIPFPGYEKVTIKQVIDAFYLVDSARTELINAYGISILPMIELMGMNISIRAFDSYIQSLPNSDSLIANIPWRTDGGQVTMNSQVFIALSEDELNRFKLYSTRIEANAAPVSNYYATTIDGIDIPAFAHLELSLAFAAKKDKDQSKANQKVYENSAYVSFLKEEIETAMRSVAGIDDSMKWRDFHSQFIVYRNLLKRAINIKDEVKAESIVAGLKSVMDLQSALDKYKAAIEAKSIEYVTIDNAHNLADADYNLGREISKMSVPLSYHKESSTPGGADVFITDQVLDLNSASIALAITDLSNAKPTSEVGIKSNALAMNNLQKLYQAVKDYEADVDGFIDTESTDIVKNLFKNLQALTGGIATPFFNGFTINPAEIKQALIRDVYRVAIKTDAGHRLLNELMPFFEDRIDNSKSVPSKEQFMGMFLFLYGTYQQQQENPAFEFQGESFFLSGGGGSGKTEVVSIINAFLASKSIGASAIGINSTTKMFADRIGLTEILNYTRSTGGEMSDAIKFIETTSNDYIYIDEATLFSQKEIKELMAAAKTHKKTILFTFDVNQINHEKDARFKSSNNIDLLAYDSDFVSQAFMIGDLMNNARSEHSSIVQFQKMLLDYKIGISEMNIAKAQPMMNAIYTSGISLAENASTGMKQLATNIINSTGRVLIVSGELDFDGFKADDKESIISQLMAISPLLTRQMLEDRLDFLSPSQAQGREWPTVFMNVRTDEKFSEVGEYIYMTATRAEQALIYVDNPIRYGTLERVFKLELETKIGDRSNFFAYNTPSNTKEVNIDFMKEFRTVFTEYLDGLYPKGRGIVNTDYVDLISTAYVPLIATPVATVPFKVLAYKLYSPIASPSTPTVSGPLLSGVYVNPITTTTIAGVATSTPVQSIPSSAIDIEDEVGAEDVIASESEAAIEEEPGDMISSVTPIDLAVIDVEFGDFHNEEVDQDLEPYLDNELIKGQGLNMSVANVILQNGHYFFKVGSLIYNLTHDSILVFDPNVASEDLGVIQIRSAIAYNPINPIDQVQSEADLVSYFQSAYYSKTNKNGLISTVTNVSLYLTENEASNNKDILAGRVVVVDVTLKKQDGTTQTIGVPVRFRKKSYGNDKTHGLLRKLKTSYSYQSKVDVAEKELMDAVALDTGSKTVTVEDMIRHIKTYTEILYKLSDFLTQYPELNWMAMALNEGKRSDTTRSKIAEILYVSLHFVNDQAVGALVPSYGLSKMTEAEIDNAYEIAIKHVMQYAPTGVANDEAAAKAWISSSMSAGSQTSNQVAALNFMSKNSKNINIVNGVYQLFNTSRNIRDLNIIQQLEFTPVNNRSLTSLADNHILLDYDSLPKEFAQSVTDAIQNAVTNNGLDKEQSAIRYYNKDGRSFVRISGNVRVAYDQNNNRFYEAIDTYNYEIINDVLTPFTKKAQYTKIFVYDESSGVYSYDDVSDEIIVSTVSRNDMITKAMDRGNVNGSRRNVSFVLSDLGGNQTRHDKNIVYTSSDIVSDFSTIMSDAGINSVWHRHTLLSSEDSKIKLEDIYENDNGKMILRPGYTINPDQAQKKRFVSFSALFSMLYRSRKSLTINQGGARYKIHLRPDINNLYLVESMDSGTSELLNDRDVYETYLKDASIKDINNGYGFRDPQMHSAPSNLFNHYTLIHEFKGARAVVRKGSIMPSQSQPIASATTSATTTASSVKSNSVFLQEFKDALNNIQC